MKSSKKSATPTQKVSENPLGKVYLQRDGRISGVGFTLPNPHYREPSKPSKP